MRLLLLIAKLERAPVCQPRSNPVKRPAGSATVVELGILRMVLLMLLLQWHICA